MKRVSTMSLAAALIFGGTTVVATAPVAAMQTGETAEEFDGGELSDAVRAAVVAAQTALQAEGTTPDTAAIQAQLEAAVPLIANEDDRFIIGQVMLQNAGKIQEQGGTPEQIQAVQMQALELSLASNRVPIESRARFWLALANAASNADDDAKAATAFQNVLRYDPNNGDALIRLADSQFNASDHANGYATALRAFESLSAAGTQIPSSWIAVPFRAAYEASDVPRIVEFGTILLREHPSAQNWNEVLRVYQTAGRLEDQPNLDLLRLMRATNGLDVNSINEYVRLAAQRGLPREAQVIYQGSVNGGAIPANEEIAAEIASNISGDQAGLAESEASARSSANGRVALNTADAYASYDNMSKALELYQVALDKGGVDAGVVNLRRGALYYNAGQTDQARAAFEAVTGDRAPHAAFWLQWLDEQAGTSAATAAAEPASAE